MCIQLFNKKGKKGFILLTYQLCKKQDLPFVHAQNILQFATKHYVIDKDN